MIEAGTLHTRQEFVTGLETGLSHRVLNAEPIKLLSKSNGKTVELARDLNGTRFIRRSYTKSGLDQLNKLQSLPFDDALAAFQQAYTAAGIAVVPSIVLHPSKGQSEFPVVVASDYIEGTALEAAPAEVKVQVAVAMGTILLKPGKYYPGFESIRHDMFRVGKGSDGKPKAILVDIDPYLRERAPLDRTERGKDDYYSRFINEVKDLLWDKWTKPTERTAVLSAFSGPVGMAVREFEDSQHEQALSAFLTLQAMANGLDLRSFSL